MKNTSSPSVSYQNTGLNSRHPANSAVANSLTSAMTLYDHGASVPPNPSTELPPTVKSTKHDPKAKPPSLSRSIYRPQPSSTPSHSLAMSHHTALPPSFQAPAYRSTINNISDSHFSSRPVPYQPIKHQFPSRNIPSQHEVRQSPSRPTSTQNAFSPLESRYLLSQAPLTPNHLRHPTTQITHYDAHSRRSPLIQTQIETVPSAPMTMAPLSTRSIFTTPEDIQMASRQLMIDTLPPQQREEQERWAQSIIGRVKTCPQNFPWVRRAGGYQCAGGRHVITDELLAEGKGGIYGCSRWGNLGGGYTTLAR